MDQMKIYILYAFGILMCVAGVIYLASEYIKYLSDAGKLTILMLMVIMFASFGKYFEERGL
jgi:hypothetical protein